MTFLVHHWLGSIGMSHRYADYLPTDEFTNVCPCRRRPSPRLRRIRLELPVG